MMRSSLPLGILAAAAVTYLLHRQAMRWGATDKEVHKRLPGDAVMSDPILETTHGVTINAPAEQVWPWLLQIGHERAGWYVNAGWWSILVSRYYQLLASEQGGKTSAGYAEFRKKGGAFHALL